MHPCRVALSTMLLPSLLFLLFPLLSSAQDATNCTGEGVLDGWDDIENAPDGGAVVASNCAGSVLAIAVVTNFAQGEEGVTLTAIGVESGI